MRLLRGRRMTSAPPITACPPLGGDHARVARLLALTPRRSRGRAPAAPHPERRRYLPERLQRERILLRSAPDHARAGDSENRPRAVPERDAREHAELLRPGATLSVKTTARMAPRV